GTCVSSHYLLSRFTAIGSPDPSFGNAGNVVAPLPHAPSATPLTGLAIQSDGKIVMAGTLAEIVNPFVVFHAVVARFNGSGAPPPPPAFNICVQNGSLIFKFNSNTGAYEFRDCAKGYGLTGTGIITVSSCKIQLQDAGPDSKHSDRNVLVKVNT